MLKAFFQAQAGKAFSFHQLNNYFSEFGGDKLKKLLDRLNEEDEIVKMEFNSQAPELALYLLPKKVVDNKSFEKIQLELSTFGFFNVGDLTVKEFKSDWKVFSNERDGKLKRFYQEIYLKKLREYFGEELRDWDGKKIAVADFKRDFLQNLLRSIILLYGSDLEGAFSKSGEIIRELLQASKQDPHLNVKDFIGKKVKEIAESRKNLRTFEEDPRLVEDLKKMVREIKKVLSSLPQIEGLIIYGSWARGRVPSDADLDLLTVSQDGLLPSEYLSLAYQIKNTLGKLISKVELANSFGFELVLSKPETFEEVFNFSESSTLAPYLRNFIIIAQDRKTLDRIRRMILSVKLASP